MGNFLVGELAKIAMFVVRVFPVEFLVIKGECTCHELGNARPFELGKTFEGESTRFPVNY